MRYRCNFCYTLHDTPTEADDCFEQHEGGVWDARQKHTPVQRDCAKCAHAATPSGKQCHTLTRRLKELVTDAGKPFYPSIVIPAMDRIASECKRYREAEN